MNLTRHGLARLIITLSIFVTIIAFTESMQAQDTRYTNEKYKISFEPPVGWIKDIDSDGFPFFTGPKHKDGSNPTFFFKAVDNPLEPSEELLNLIAKTSIDLFRSQRYESITIIERQMIDISGFKSLQVDASLTKNGFLFRMREVLIPANRQKQLYIFILLDTATGFAESATIVANTTASFRVGTGTLSDSSKTQPSIKTNKAMDEFLARIEEIKKDLPPFQAIGLSLHSSYADRYGLQPARCVLTIRNNDPARTIKRVSFRVDVYDAMRRIQIDHIYLEGTTEIKPGKVGEVDVKIDSPYFFPNKTEGTESQVEKVVFDNASVYENPYFNISNPTLLLYEKIVGNADSNPKEEFGSSLAKSPEDGQVKEITDVAKIHFERGREAYAKSDYNLARKEFDEAIDTILLSSASLRHDNVLRTYRELIERIHYYQLASLERKDGGFKEQKYEPPSLNKLTSLSDSNLKESRRDEPEKARQQNREPQIRKQQNKSSTRPKRVNRNP